MKTKMSMKNACMFADYVFSIGYCDLQWILRRYEASAYNAGVYGWNCDIYRFYRNGKTICITTGYRNTRGERVDYHITEKYNQLAKKICSYGEPEHIADYTKQQEAIDNLLNEFLDKIVNE